MDRQIAVLKQQYLQLVEPSCLSFPPAHVLQQPAFQAALCTGLFIPGTWDAAPPPPPQRYTARVLKRLISLLSEGGVQERTMAETTFAENSLQEKEENVRSQPPHKKPKPDQPPASPKHQEIDERILSLYTRLLSNPSSSTTPFPPTSKENVTYTLPPSPFSGRPIGPPITLLESRPVISGSGTTGLRTWEAALALAEYLIVSHLGRFYRFPGAVVVAGPRLVDEAGSVLELGAGTGLVGIVAARLGAGRVVVTDGNEGVCDALKAGLERNGVADVVSVKRLMWGERDGKEEEDNEGERFDLVVGADVIYDSSTIPPFVAELVRRFHKNPSAKVVISATIRDEDTFSFFRDSCVDNSLFLSEITWTPPTPPIFYYPTVTPIRIIHVTRE
ncbi:putative methyltransferase-domain-containing protein [Tuber brumale]|nr:putative methyltransferase-domain-containing protein [Tuber brumale]